MSIFDDQDSDLNRSKKSRLKIATWVFRLTSCFPFFIPPLNDSKRKNLSSQTNQSINFNDDIKLRQFSIDSLNNLNNIQFVSSDNLNEKSKNLINNTTNQAKSSNTILNYSLHLSETSKSLKLNILSIENVYLTNMMTSTNQDLNVYIKIEMLTPIDNDPRKLIAKTRLIKNRKSPMFDETFEFHNLDDLIIYLKDLQNQNSNILCNSYRLMFNICNSNLFGRDQLIGQIVHSFTRNDFQFENNQCKIYSKKVDLVDGKPNDINLGQIHISLIYNNENKTIKLHLIRANDLKIPNIYLNTKKKISKYLIFVLIVCFNLKLFLTSSILDPYIKIYLLYGGQRIDKKQTKIFENTNEPEFDEIIEFKLKSLMQMAHNQQLNNDGDDKLINLLPESEPTSYLKDKISESDEIKIASKLRIFFLVMDYDKIEKSDLIGKIEMTSQFEDEKKREMSLSSSKRQIKGSTSIAYSAKNKKAISLDVENQNKYNANENSTSGDINKNWYDIFNKPNQPIYCSFQIKNLN